ncbi:hypothetical protein HY637_00385 [Candidatus Woesearchaeota archaeon]|nr:hypothetical protein [Candidatus Woesearchaeota archaeon]
MKLNKLLTKKGIFFLLIFSILVFVGERINLPKLVWPLLTYLGIENFPLFRLVGAENQFFTLFQFFGPIAGFFLGPVVGVLSVLIAEIAGKIYVHTTFDLVTVLRLAPMLFAAWYFGTKKDKLSFLIPIAAIILFVAHPIGRQVWYFSLFWTIPIIVKLLPKKYGERAFLKGLGATFTAHAVGGAMWNYLPSVSMTPALWNNLIPMVIAERILFAAGIAGSFILFNTLLDKADSKTKSEYLSIDKRYVLFKNTA